MTGLKTGDGQLKVKDRRNIAWINQGISIKGTALTESHCRIRKEKEKMSISNDSKNRNL